MLSLWLTQDENPSMPAAAEAAANKTEADASETDSSKVTVVLCNLL